MIGGVTGAFVLTVLAGLSTGAGSTIAYFIREPKLSYLSFLMGFSAGVMIYVSFIELLTSSINNIGFFKGNISLFAGIVGIYLIDKLIPHAHMDMEPDSFHESSEFHERLKNAGILTAVGIAIHNFPEGIAVFAISLESISTGLPVAIAIAIHNIPEGIAVSVPIYYATGDERKSFGYSFFSGVAEPIGAISGYLLFRPWLSGDFLYYILAAVAGVMIFISFDELLPISRDYGGEHVSTVGLFSGMFVMMTSLWAL